MNLLSNTLFTVQNQKATLTVDSYGGAITDFHLNSELINPLNFKFCQADMPDNNKKGAPYQGHFVCIGHWGEPSEGEKKSGLPNHGHFANISWTAIGNDRIIMMEASSNLEGLDISRKIEIDPENAVTSVKEIVTNMNPLGRLFNMVQHPTLSSPFLNNSTVVNCNAGIGFNQAYSGDPYQYALSWPLGYSPHSSSNDLRTPNKSNSLHSFIVDKDCKHGWITAFSPKHQTVFGYLWKRSDYPWIHLWQDWQDDMIRFRGIEFGTAGYHMPYKEMIRHPLNIFDENVCTYLDAGETVTRSFLSFLFKVDERFTGVEDLELSNGTIKIKGEQGEEISLNTAFKDF